jgi:hypothetical protein
MPADKAIVQTDVIALMPADHDPGLVQGEAIDLGTADHDLQLGARQGGLAGFRFRVIQAIAMPGEFGNSSHTGRIENSIQVRAARQDKANCRWPVGAFRRYLLHGCQYAWAEILRILQHNHGAPALTDFMPGKDVQKFAQFITGGLEGFKAQLLQHALQERPLIARRGGQVRVMSNFRALQKTPD